MSETGLSQANKTSDIITQSTGTTGTLEPFLARVPAGEGDEHFPAMPLYSSSVRAGFPTPADEYVESWIDLNEFLVRNPLDTFFVKASGDSMTGVGIHSGDMLVVDSGLEPVHGNIIVAALDGELTVKRLSHHEGRVQLLSANDKYPAIDVHDDMEFLVWGVVTRVLHVPE